MPVIPTLELQNLLLWTLLNPAAIGVAWWIGRRADQVQKIVVGAFAAAFAGILLGWVGAKLGLPGSNMKSLAGLFAFCFLYGLLWSWIGFRTRPR